MSVAPARSAVTDVVLLMRMGRCWARVMIT